MTAKPFDEDSAEPMRRFARPLREGVHDPNPLFCRHLRAKARYLPESGADTGSARAAPAQYWCLRTMRPDGPDGALALPEDCTDERICFEPPAGPEAQS